MSFVAVGVAGGAAIAGIAGAAISSHAAGEAADKQAASAKDANQQQWDMYQQQRSDQQPWREAGAKALSQLGDPSFNKTFGAADFQADPGYQFRMKQGQDAIERSAAARGGLQSGGTLKALNEYGQGFASNEYQNAYSRFTNDQNNRFNRLATVAGVGQTANGMTGQAGMNAANNMGQNTMGAANASGAASIASGNAWGGALSGLGNAGMQAAYLNKMPNYGGGGSGGGGNLSGLGSLPSMAQRPVE